MQLDHLSLVISIVSAIPVFWALLKKTGSRIKGFMRGNRLRALRKIRSMRHNIAEINYISSSTYSYKALFILSTCSLYLMLDLSEIIWVETAKAIVPTLVLTFFVIFFEICWLSKRDVTKKLLKAHGKLLRYQRKRCLAENQ